MFRKKGGVNTGVNDEAGNMSDRPCHVRVAVDGGVAALAGPRRG